MTRPRGRIPLLALLALSTAALAAPAPAGAAKTIGTFAGELNQAGFNGDGLAGPATQLNFPIDVATIPLGQGGGFLIADEGNHRIRKLRADGIVVTVAGNGEDCAGHLPNDVDDPCGDRGPARKASLAQPTGVAALPGGGFLIADRGAGVVRKVNNAGKISTVAGTGASCTPVIAATCGDGGPATAAAFDNPNRAVPTNDGGYLVTEDTGNRVRKVWASGTVTTVAGNPFGVPCAAPTTACGDKGAATSALLNGPNGVAPLLDGTSFLIADSSDNRVRLVDSQGNIFTIAGTGDAGSSGNGVAPKTAELNAPSSVAVASDGGVIVADTNSHIVRRIFQGKIKTIAGIADQAGAGADGVAGTASKLNTPYAVAVSAGGQVLIADHLTQRVRVLASAYVPQ
jgi:hypothetical protein